MQQNTIFSPIVTNAMDYTGLNILSLYHEPVHRNDQYFHKNQLEFYRTEDRDEQFRLRYRFCKDTVRLLTELVREETLPKARTNNVYSS